MPGPGLRAYLTHSHDEPTRRVLLFGELPWKHRKDKRLAQGCLFLGKARILYSDPGPLIPESKPGASDCEGEGGPE